MKELIDYFFKKLQEAVVWYKTTFKKPTEVVPVPPPKPADPVVPTPPVTPTPVEPPAQGPNGFQPTSGVFTESAKHEYLWLNDGIPFKFTLTMPAGKTSVYLTGRPTPLMGYGSGERDEVKIEVMEGNTQVVKEDTYSIGGASIEFKAVPGKTYSIFLTAVGMSRGTVWQVWFN